MPLIWHISLLVFVQRYKHQLTTADRDALQHLTTVQHHYKVSFKGPRNSVGPCEQELCLCWLVGCLETAVSTSQFLEHLYSRD